MSDNMLRDFGVQPLVDIMVKCRLKPHDLVVASTKQLTHKMVTRGCKGRKLTVNSKLKVLQALNLASDKEYCLGDLFNY